MVPRLDCLSGPTWSDERGRIAHTSELACRSVLSAVNCHLLITRVSKFVLEDTWSCIDTCFGSSSQQCHYGTRSRIKIHLWPLRDLLLSATGLFWITKTHSIFITFFGITDWSGLLTFRFNAISSSNQPGEWQICDHEYHS